MSASAKSNSPGELGGAHASTVLQNFLAVGSGEAIARAVAFAGLLYLARRVGAAGYGVIAFSAGITLYLAKIADFGIEMIGTDEIAKHRDSIPRIGSALLGMRFLITVPLILLAFIVIQVSASEPERTVLSLFLLTLLPIAANTKWIHLGLEVGRPVGLWRVVGEVVTLALVVGFIWDTSHLWRMPAAMVVGDVLAVIGLYWLLRRQGHSLGLRWDPKTALPVFKRALPMVGQVMAGLLIYNSDIFFLRVMRSAEAVGFYAAAYALISFLANICTLYGMTLLPTLTRLGKNTDEERNLYHTALAQVFAVTLPISVGGMFVANTVIRLGFGKNYEPSARILEVLIWVVLPYALRVVPWSALIAHGHQQLVFRATAYAVLVNTVLNFILIYFYGVIGAAAATIATELMLAGVLMFRYGVREGLSVAPRRRFWRPVVAVLVMSGALWFLRDAHIGLQLTLAAGTYGLVLLSVGGIKIRDGLPSLAV
jgi:O-antigen/teichoic acid export membrane protein